LIFFNLYGVFMKRFSLLAVTTILAALMFGMVSCSDDDDDEKDDPVVIDPIELTQAMLDGSTSEIEIDVTGTDFPHGPGTTGDDTFRDIYTTMADGAAVAQAGDLITKRTYVITDGVKADNPAVTFAMVKQEAGYNSEDGLGDWIWYSISSSSITDYSTNPNGLFENAVRVDDNTACAGCHGGLGDEDMRFTYPS
jgi:hypothetical protein